MADSAVCSLLLLLLMFDQVLPPVTCDLIFYRFIYPLIFTPCFKPLLYSKLQKNLYFTKTTK